jgi:hypothetical protein
VDFARYRAAHRETVVSTSKPLVFAIAALVGAFSLALAPSIARAADLKFVSGADCQPYAPDTVAAELQVTQNGVYNPGTVNEKVICPMPRDAQAEYASGAIDVQVYYRVLGAAPGRLTCTLFIGSTAVQSTALITTTVSGPLVSNGTRSSISLSSGGSMDPDLGPNNLICTISPKTILGGIYLQENNFTDSDYAYFLP